MSSKPRQTTAGKAINAMNEFMFSERQSAVSTQLSWDQTEGYFVHKFKLRGRELTKFLKLSKEWGGRSLI